MGSKSSKGILVAIRDWFASRRIVSVNCTFKLSPHKKFKFLFIHNIEKVNFSAILYYTVIFSNFNLFLFFSYLKVVLSVYIEIIP